MIYIIKNVWRTRIAPHKNSLHKNSVHKNTKLITNNTMLLTTTNKLIILSNNLIISTNNHSISSNKLSILVHTIIVQAILVQRYSCAPSIIYYINYSI